MAYAAGIICEGKRWVGKGFLHEHAHINTRTLQSGAQH
eukprot:COSAG01_NODE_52302_length_347_cov_1.395161_1_plen_37_part_01